ncbi:MAG: hypothetical protein JWN83_1270 [Chitinophagaceae bacterium]|nr:hypothetical protein [Chitinophagaceae bacterium]
MIFIFLVLFSSAQTALQVKYPVNPQGFYATVEFSNDGKLILFSEHQRTYLVDAFTGRTIYDFKNTGKSSLSADGKYILIQYSESVDVWEIASQRSVYHFAAPASNTIHNAVLTADSKFLTIAVANSSSWPVTFELQNIDLISKKQLNKIALADAYPSLANSTKTYLVASYSFAGKTIIYNIETGTPVYTIDIGVDTIRTVEFSPDDRWLAATTGNKICIYNASNGKLSKTLLAHTAPVTAASFSHDSKSVISSSLDKTIKIWDIASGKVIKNFEEKDPVYQVSFSAKDNYLIASTGYNYLDIRNIATGKKHNPLFLELAKYAGRKQISPDEQLYYASSQVLKLSNAETVHEFTNELSEIKTTEASTDGRYIATIRGYNNISIWDMTTAKLVADFGMPDTSRYLLYAMDIKFSADNKKLFTGWNNGALWQWNIEEGKADTVVRTGGYIQKLMLNKKKDQLLVISDSSVTSLDAYSLKKNYQFKTGNFKISDNNPLIYSPDESVVLINGGQSKKAYLLNAATGITIKEIDKENWDGLPIITQDNKKLVIVYSGLNSFVYDLETGKELIKLKAYGGEFISAWAELAQKDSNLLVFVNSTYPVAQTLFQTVNLHSGKATQSFPFPSFNKMYYDDFSPSFITLSADSLKMWDSKTFKMQTAVEAKKMYVDSVNKRVIVQNEFSVDVYSDQLTKILSLVSFGKTNVSDKYVSSGGIAVLHNNYYKTDPAAVSKIHLQSGLKVIGINQLDVLLNRPDKVMEEIHSKDTALIRAYRSAFEKRLRKLSLPEKFVQNTAVPFAEIKNRNKIPSEQLATALKLSLSAYDSASFIDKYNVWVNEVPVFGSKGIDISKNNTNKLAVEVTINLSKGENHIEFSVTNQQGKESYRQPLKIYQGTKKTLEQVHGYQAYDANAPKEGTVYFIGIGIDKFSNNTYNLQWSVKDIRDLATNMADKNFMYTTVIDTLFNENVTAGNIKAIKKKLLNTTVNDKVIIAYSGHGLLSSDFDYYLSTYDVNFLQPEQGGLSYDALEGLMDSIPARKKLMLIDACHSGEVDKEEMQKIKAANKQAGQTRDGAKGVDPVETGDEKKIGMKNSFELMQELFVNLGRNTGTTIISAAAGTQFALERGDLKNGVFSYSILEYMKEHAACTVSELKQYVNKRVPELTNGLQQPTTRTETKAVDWEVW